jgi:general secretion pathway protein G
LRNGERLLQHGFTVIELIVVLAAIGLLLAIAAPRYVQHVDHAREVALREDLHAVRVSIDQFHADQLRYPASLDELVSRKYLQSVPVDPMTGRADSWKLDAASGEGAGAIVDLHSGADGHAVDGSAYASW